MTPKRIAKFWSQVDASGECWNWTGYINSEGYGWFWRGKSLGPEATHRISYKIAHPGDVIPAGYCVCHTCDNRKCVNPAHLFLGTIQDNIDDMVQKNRHRNRGPKRKLDPEKVMVIRRLAKCGYTQREIANRFDIAITYVNRVITGKTWGWISGELRGGE